MKCESCLNPATVEFAWVISIGKQTAIFCDKCASEAWAKYKNTPAFGGIKIKYAEASCSTSIS